MSDSHVGITSLAQGAARGPSENSMQRERQRRAGQDERRGARRTPRAAVQPIVMAARRPRTNAVPALADAPSADGSDAEPSQVSAVDEPPHASSVSNLPSAPSAAPQPRRSARIVATSARAVDTGRAERERLLARFMGSQGRAMISRAADECRRAGVEFPREQAVQLQLLEHVDEGLAREAIGVLAELLAGESPTKRPILEQRLRRLEDTADEEATRTAAAELRRALRG
jgi:hypothetical protein